MIIHDLVYVSDLFLVWSRIILQKTGGEGPETYLAILRCCGVISAIQMGLRG